MNQLMPGVSNYLVNHQIFPRPFAKARKSVFANNRNQAI